MGYRVDCKWLIHTRSRGRKCGKGVKTTMDGCPCDCPLYEKG